MYMEYANMVLMNFPSPRYEVYEDPAFQNIKLKVLKYFEPVINDLGFYPIAINIFLLDQMESYSYASMLLGLVFEILLIIFIIVSCLLVYSLLMMSVETKTFDIAVMRLVGLT